MFAPLPFADKTEDDIIYDKIHHRTLVRGAAPNFLSTIMDFVKQFQNGVDPVNISAPSFMLSGVSILEMEAITFCPSQSLIDAASRDDPMERMLDIALSMFPVMKHFCTTGQDKAGKPYNPILGEQFHALWDHLSVPIFCTSEQVSHHPPVSCVYVECPHAGIQVESTHKWKVAFGLNSVTINTLGSVLYRFMKHGEEYKVKMPGIICNNVIVGSNSSHPYGELVIENEKLNIKLVMKFESDTKIRAKVFNAKEVTHTIKGDYHKLHITSVNNKKERVLHECKSYGAIALPTVKPVAKQHAIESRRVWYDCTVNIAKSNWDDATMAKHKIEEKQRQLAKQRAEQNAAPWQPSLFEPTGEIVDGIPIHKYKFAATVTGECSPIRLD